MAFLLYEGEEGQDFITVEHCGDDFLAALAEYVQDSEDWEDLQAIESEACGALNNIFDSEVHRNDESSLDDNGVSPIYVSGDSPTPSENQSLTQLDSSSDREDSDFRVTKRKKAESSSLTSHDGKSHNLTQTLEKHPSKSKVEVLLEKCLLTICRIAFSTHL